MCSSKRILYACANGCKRCVPLLPKREAPISLPLPLPTTIPKKMFQQEDNTSFNTKPSDRDEIGAAIARNLYSPP
jgi:hypothetical protein